MTDKQINAWLRRRFSLIGWGLIGFYVLMNLLASFGMGLDLLKQALTDFASGRSPRPDMAAAANNAWGYLLTVAVALMILHAGKGQEHFHREIWAREKPMTAKIFCSLLCLCIGAQMINTLWITALEMVMNSFGRSVFGVLETVSGATDTFSMFLYASIAAPVAEELIFRGYILRALRPYGKRFAIFTSALLFGLFHGNLLQTPYALLVGLVLSYVTVEHSIVWAIGIHVFNNLVLADLLTRLTMQWSEMAAGLLNLGVFGSCLLLSVAILQKHRHEIRDYRAGEWMDRRVLRCFFTNSGIIVLMVLMAGNMLLMLFA